MRACRHLALDRRTFLRSAAGALALPWLDAMQPALRPMPKAPVRYLFVFGPNGRNMQAWTPHGTGPDAVFGSTLEPLQALRDRVTVFGGLAIDGGRSHGDGNGDHARAGGSFLTCAHPRKTGGADLQAGLSIDQRLAAGIGGNTSFASLELGLEKGAAAGVCDSGYSCAYTNNISWRTPNTPVAKETDPRAVFARLFGDPDRGADAAAARVDRAREHSVLDAVTADAKSLAGRLGPADRQKLDQYLHAVRELEQRLARLDADAVAEVAPTPVPPSLQAASNGFAERMAAMYELIALAFATDRTRVVTLMLGNAGSNRSHRFLGVPDGHHELSHHGGKQEKLAALATIDHFYVEQFARFLDLLRQHGESGADLLSSSLVLFGSGIGDGNAHNHDQLPMLLAGEGGGAAKGRGHVELQETPLANLYLAMLHAAGLPDESFADSTGALALA